MLTGKQRRFLRSLGQHEQPILHIGKYGVTATVLRQAREALAARELIKGRVLEAAAAETIAVAQQIATETGADVVQIIGRNFLLFKPDLTDPKIRIHD